MRSSADRALAELPATPSNLPALVGRGEASSLLGNHRAARADLAEAGRLLAVGRMHPDLDLQGLTAVYMDRYEAVLLQGLLEHGLAYATAAERLYDPGPCPGSSPTPWPWRPASWPGTSKPNSRRPCRAPSIPWARRAIPSREGDRTAYSGGRRAPAGRRVVARSARRTGAMADLAGRGRPATMRRDGPSKPSKPSRKPLAATDEDDPRRGRLMERLARCLQAEARFDEAAGWYQAVIETWPSSPDATRCCAAGPVPRGDGGCRCGLVESRAGGENGRTVLTPDAVDWMDALRNSGARFPKRSLLGSLPHLDAFLARAVESQPRTDAAAGGVHAWRDPATSSAAWWMIRRWLRRCRTCSRRDGVRCSSGPARLLRTGGVGLRSPAGAHRGHAETLRTAMIGHGDAATICVATRRPSESTNGPPATSRITPPPCMHWCRSPEHGWNSGRRATSPRQALHRLGRCSTIDDEHRLADGSGDLGAMDADHAGDAGPHGGGWMKSATGRRPYEVGMTDTSFDTATWIDELIRLLENQEAVVLRTRRDGSGAGVAHRGGDVDRLLVILGRRQQLVERLPAQATLGTMTRNLEARLAEVDDVRRGRVRSLMDGVDQCMQGSAGRRIGPQPARGAA